jgi:hypothetical protein
MGNGARDDHIVALLSIGVCASGSFRSPPEFGGLAASTLDAMFGTSLLAIYPVVSRRSQALNQSR